MLVVEWWPSFACPGSQAEGKRYHDWDGCIERITQLDSWPDVRTGSSTEMLRVSISRPLFLTKADAAGPCRGPPARARLARVVQCPLTVSESCLWATGQV